jgi:hypothetical protein
MGYALVLSCGFSRSDTHVEASLIGRPNPSELSCEAVPHHTFRDHSRISASVVLSTEHDGSTNHPLLVCSFHALASLLMAEEHP